MQRAFFICVGEPRHFCLELRTVECATCRERSVIPPRTDPSRELRIAFIGAVCVGAVLLFDFALQSADSWIGKHFSPDVEWHNFGWPLLAGLCIAAIVMRSYEAKLFTLPAALAHSALAIGIIAVSWLVGGVVAVDLHWFDPELLELGQTRQGDLVGNLQRTWLFGASAGREIGHIAAISFLMIQTQMRRKLLLQLRP